MQQLLTLSSLLFFIWTTHASTPQETTHYRVNSAQMQSILYPPYPATPGGRPEGQDSASKFELSVQGINSGALPVLCSLDVQNPGNKMAPPSASSQTIPFRCNDTAVSASWTRTNVTSLNGEVTVQLAGAHPAVWVLGNHWTLSYNFDVVTDAAIENWVFTGPIVI